MKRLGPGESAGTGIPAFLTRLAHCERIYPHPKGHGTLRTRLVVVRYGIVYEHRMTRTDAVLQLGGLRLLRLRDDRSRAAAKAQSIARTWMD